MATHRQKLIQLRLEQDQMDLLQTLAQRRGVSAEELVRDRVVEMLDEEDPFLRIIGMFSSGLGDLAENHDKYLAEYEIEDNKLWPKKSS